MKLVFHELNSNENDTTKRGNCEMWQSIKRQTLYALIVFLFIGYSSETVAHSSVEFIANVNAA